MDGNVMIISIDFGTTYSGVAYVLVKEPTKVRVVTDWSGARGGVPYEKCPTLLKYEDNGDIKWGYELDRSTEGRIEAIKLLLDPDQTKPLYVPETDTTAMLQKLSKAPAAVATDFLAAMMAHASQKIAAQYLPGYFDGLKKEYILIKPRTAARDAGIHPVRLIKEPEAAALCALQEFGDKGLNVGDAFVLCDAGGGTVDLISYQILKKKPLEVKELVEAEGGLAGSLMLNKRFEGYLKSVFGEQDFIKLREAGKLGPAMRLFNDEVKPGFWSSGADEFEFHFPHTKIPDIPEKGFEESCLTVSKTKLLQLFEPVIHDISRMVTEQIKSARLKRLEEQHPSGKEIKAVVLVGGFGASEYLHARLKEKHPDVEVIQPPDAWSAIVRGAAIYPLPAADTVSVVSNVSPKHYGTSYLTPDFDQSFFGEDYHRERIWNPFLGKDTIEKMFWYIHKGDDLQRSRPIELPLHRNFDPHPTPEALRVEEMLFELDAEEAPKHPKSGMKRNCTIQVDLSQVPTEAFEEESRVTETGETLRWWALSYQLMLTISSGPMQFSVKCQGKEYNAVTAAY